MLCTILFNKFSDEILSAHRTLMIKFFIIVLLLINSSGSQFQFPQAIAQTDLSRIGISNDNLTTKGDEIFGATDEQTSLEKLRLKDEATKKEIANQICDQSPTDELCSTIPNDNLDFSELFVYMFILAAAQNSFDVFSWQTFIGLNWPLDSSGKPSDRLNEEEIYQYRPWFNFKTPQEIFAPNHRDDICHNADDSNSPYLLIDNFIQTGGKPLIDKNLNFVVYDVRVNELMAQYIIENGLQSIEGQWAFKDSGQDIDFPVGHYDDPINKTGGDHGSMALKTAWKIIDTQSGDNPDRYFTVNGRIAIDAKSSESGQPFCIESQLGLVGMHIMRRTDSGNGRDWTWSTFEHVDNSPIAANSRRPADTLQKVLFENGCTAPESDQIDRSYAFFNPDCVDCETNKIDQAQWKWSKSMPYAKSYAVNDRFGTQVVRCWQTFDGTELINNVWQKKLEGTVWANYQLFSAQWKGADPNPMFPNGEVPRFLTNTTMETYGQISHDGSCLSCHDSARTVASQESNFSFILSMAAKYANLQTESDQTAAN